MPVRWKKEDTNHLWMLYETREIDPFNNDFQYILRKVKQHFPVWTAGLTPGRVGEDCAVRRIRTKNNIRRIQLAQHREDEGDQTCQIVRLVRRCP